MTDPVKTAVQAVTNADANANQAVKSAVSDVQAHPRTAVVYAAGAGFVLGVVVTLIAHFVI